MFRNCYIKSSERVKHSWLKRTKQRRHARPLNEKGQQFIIMLRSATVRLLIIIIIVWVLKTKIKIINQEFAQSTRVAINWLSLERDRSKWTIWYSIKCCFTFNTGFLVEMTRRVQTLDVIAIPTRYDRCTEWQNSLQ